MLVLLLRIDAACKQYTEVATRGSILYFVIADLANINPMRGAKSIKTPCQVSVQLVLFRAAL